MDQKENAQALYTILRNEHAKSYSGLDDEMGEHCDEWISDLSEDEVADICISIFRNGI